MFNLLIKPVAELFSKALGIVDKLVEDKDLARKIKAELESKIIEIANTQFLALLKAQSSVIIAEAQGESWMQRNWRPLLMLVFVVIIANNYIIAPYLSLFFVKSVTLDVPAQMWKLLSLGVSGYVVGRSCEKISNGSGIKGGFNKFLNGNS